MPSFSDLAKSIGTLLSKTAFRFRALEQKNTKTGSGFSRWRECYNLLKARQEKFENSAGPELQEKLPKIRDECFSKSLQSGTPRFYSSTRLPAGDEGSASKTSVPMGMRYARLLSMNAQQLFCPTTSLFRLSKRWKCGRENCKDPCFWPLCPPGNQRYERKTKMFNIYKAYWDERSDECCEDPCQWALPRLDDIYQTESDKHERIYQRTWWECPPREVPKRICCLNEAIPPEFCKRPKKERPPTACERPCPLGDHKCPVVESPCCCKRWKKKCRPLLRKPLECKRYCTPYPSFSECARDKLRTGPPKECRCLAPVGMCEYWTYWRHRFAHRSQECV